MWEDNAYLEGLIDLALHDTLHKSRWQGKGLYEAAQPTLCSSPVLELDAHALALLLKGADLGADVAEIALELAQHLLHACEDGVAAADLRHYNMTWTSMVYRTS